MWRERNRRQFQGLSMPALALGSLFWDYVRACLCSWRKLKPTDDNRLLARNWNLSPRVLVQCALAILLLVPVFLVSLCWPVKLVWDFPVVLGCLLQSNG